MANQTKTLKDTKVSVQEGRDPGPNAQKPQEIKVEMTKPGYQPPRQVPKRGGGQ